LREGRDDSFMLHPVEVSVSASESIPKNYEGSDGTGGEDLSSKRLVNSTVNHGADVTNESIRRAVLHPFVVSVHSSTVFTAAFSVRFSKERFGRGWAHLERCGGGS